jgi:hypothetical protein
MSESVFLDAAEVDTIDVEVFGVLLTEAILELAEGIFDGVGRGVRDPVFIFQVELFDEFPVFVILVAKNIFAADVFPVPFDGRFDVVVWSGLFDTELEAKTSEADGSCW